MKAIPTIKKIGLGVGVAGAVGIVVIAPNALLAYDQLARIYRKGSNKSYADYLRRSGYFDLRQNDGQFVITLSAKGSKKFGNKPFDNYAMPAPDNWDGNWHLLMFDIPETHKNVRKYIAAQLTTLGLRLVQDSVYVYYADTAELAARIRSQFPAIARLIISAQVSRIDGEDQLKKAFKLH